MSPDFDQNADVCAGQVINADWQAPAKPSRVLHGESPRVCQESCNGGTYRPGQGYLGTLRPATRCSKTENWHACCQSNPGRINKMNPSGAAWHVHLKSLPSMFAWMACWFRTDRHECRRVIASCIDGGGAANRIADYTIQDSRQRTSGCAPFPQSSGSFRTSGSRRT